MLWSCIRLKHYCTIDCLHTFFSNTIVRLISWIAKWMIMQPECMPYHADSNNSWKVLLLIHRRLCKTSPGATLTKFEIFPDKRICKRIVNRRGNGLGVYDCIRGSTGFSSGLHIWEIEWIPMDGNLFPSCTWIPRDTPGRRLNGAQPAEWLIGVATREAALDSQLANRMDKE